MKVVIIHTWIFIESLSNLIEYLRNQEYLQCKIGMEKGKSSLNQFVILLVGYEQYITEMVGLETLTI